jgi:hypothetical protein
MMVLEFCAIARISFLRARVIDTAKRRCAIQQTAWLIPALLTLISRRQRQALFNRYREFSIAASDHADRVSARPFLGTGSVPPLA